MHRNIKLKKWRKKLFVLKKKHSVQSNESQPPFVYECLISPGHVLALCERQPAHTQKPLPSKLSSSSSSPVVVVVNSNPSISTLIFQTFCGTLYSSPSLLQLARFLANIQREEKEREKKRRNGWSLRERAKVKEGRVRGSTTRVKNQLSLCSLEFSFVLFYYFLLFLFLSISKCIYISCMGEKRIRVRRKKRRGIKLQMKYPMREWRVKNCRITQPLDFSILLFKVNFRLTFHFRCISVNLFYALEGQLCLPSMILDMRLVELYIAFYK